MAICVTASSRSPPVFTFVDIRDVALAHIRALTVPEAGGKRFYVVGDYFSNPRLASIIRRRFSQRKDLLPSEEEAAKDDFPEDRWAFDNIIIRSRDVLGLDYTDLESSVVDTVESVLKFDRREEALIVVSTAEGSSLRQVLSVTAAR